MPGIWRKPPSKTDLVNSFPLQLQVIVCLPWHSADMSPTGACGTEASSRQSKPEATQKFERERERERELQFHASKHWMQPKFISSYFLEGGFVCYCKMADSYRNSY